MFPPDVATAAAADVMVTQFDGVPSEEALRLAQDLRSAGLRVDVYPDVDKLGKQFKYAASRGVQLVTVMGADERARGEVKLKNMLTGEQVAVARAEVARHVARAARVDDGRTTAQRHDDTTQTK